MLKRADSASEPPPGASARPIGEIVGQLVDDGKAYARSEVEVARAIAAAKARQLIWPGVLFLAALLLAVTSLSALAMGLFFTLYAYMPALLAGLLAFAILAAVAAFLGWLGANRLKTIL
jgi:hypothetical protein